MSRDFKGIWIPKEIWLHKGISMSAKALWAEIHSLYDPKYGGCYASNDHLCKFLGVKKRNLQYVISELKEAGLLEQHTFDGRHRVLRAIVPPATYEQSYEQKQTENRRTNRSTDGLCTSDVQNFAPDAQYFAPQGCNILHPSQYIENKEEKEYIPPPLPRGGAPTSSFKTYGEHKNCRLTEEEHKKLLEKMPASELEYWINTLDVAIGNAGGFEAFQKKYKYKTKTNFYQILTWRRTASAQGKTAMKSTGSPDANKEYAQHVASNYAIIARQKRINICVGNGYIEFCSTQCQKEPIVIKFSDHGFKEQVDNTLRKMGLMRDAGIIKKIMEG